jgi:flagellar biosynthetic protein FlhB
MSDREDKTLAPTPRRRQQAREAGQVAKSHDLVSAVLMLGSLGLLVFAGGNLLSYLAEFLKHSLGGGAWQQTVEAGSVRDAVVESSQTLSLELGRRLLPLIGGAGVLALAAHLVQSGILFLPNRVLPELSRVNPARGLGNLASGSNLARVAFGLGKVAVVLAVGATGLWSRREEVIQLAAFDAADLGTRAWELCLSSCLEMGAALLALASLDYLYQRWRLERDLHMSPQEFREELREMQGDPRLAARRRDLARQRAAQGNGHGEQVSTDRRPLATTPSSISGVDSIR